MKYQPDAVEQKIIDLIDSHREEILGFARDVYTHAELGYREYRTSEKFSNIMKDLGLSTTENVAVTGVKAYLNPEKKSEMSLALIGELDALRIPEHKHVNPETMAAHCCGHHAQLAGVVGAAYALVDETVRNSLGGQVVFFAVPAEEYGEIEFIEKLKSEGKIRYGGGKCELIRIGAFDDIDLNLTHHTSDGGITVGTGSNNGFVSKVIRYKGTAAHAAAMPHAGANALNAASLGLTALAYQRETFKDEDSVRVHPIITKGGNLVNVVPDEVVVETLVRAGNVEAIIQTSDKVDRAFASGAMGIGTDCEITTVPGYLPIIANEANEEMFIAANLASRSGGAQYPVQKKSVLSHSGGSTDVGDLQHIRPVLNFTTGGKISGLHSVDFDIVDEELAYIVTAKIFALTAYRLLKNGAEAAKEVVENYHPVFTKEEYISYMDSFIKEECFSWKEKK